MGKLTKRRDIEIGMAIAAAIVISSHQDEVIAEEILRAGGMDTLAKLRRFGVDDYDIDILRPLLRFMAGQDKSARQRRSQKRATPEALRHE